jgi:uncharacterized protein YegP (UPF0339 family)
MAKFVITQNNCGAYQVLLISKAGIMLLASPGYPNKSSCVKILDQIRACCMQGDKFQKKINKDWEPYFHLISTHGSVLATSCTFPSILAREKAIKNVQKLVQNALIEDLYDI